MNIWLHRGSLAAALALALLAVPAQAQQDAAVLKRATELREGPPRRLPAWAPWRPTAA